LGRILNNEIYSIDWVEYSGHFGEGGGISKQQGSDESDGNGLGQIGGNCLTAINGKGIVKKMGGKSLMQGELGLEMGKEANSNGMDWIKSYGWD
jgi:hypothetical protein